MIGSLTDPEYCRIVSTFFDRLTDRYIDRGRSVCVCMWGGGIFSYYIVSCVVVSPSLVFQIIISAILSAPPDVPYLSTV